MIPNITIIFGKTKPGQNGTGKSFLASNLLLLFNNYFFIPGIGLSRRIDDPFLFQGLENTHDVIFIDDVLEKDFLDVCTLFFSSSITVENQGKPRFKIKTPKVILALDADYDFIKSLNIPKYRGLSFIQCSIIETEGNRLFMTDKLSL